MVLFVNCFVVFHFLMCFNNYVNLRYIQLNLGNIIAAFLRKGCQDCLSPVYFVTA